MSEDTNMYYLTWQEIEEAAEIVTEKIKHKDFKGLIGVARGGLVPTALIAQMLPNRNIDVISMATYDGYEQRETAELFKMVDGDGEGMVVIDDLSDTGKSYKLLREKLPQAFFVTLYIKPEGGEFVDVYAKEFIQDTWLVFPWERD